MKKYLLSFGLIVAFALYVALRNRGSSDIAGNLAANGPAVGAAPPPAATSAAPSAPPAQTPPRASRPKPPAAAAGGFKDGAYAGPATDAFYGIVQAEAIISGGRLFRHPAAGRRAYL